MRRTVIIRISRFVTETAAWGWDEVPNRVLFSRGGIPTLTDDLHWVERVRILNLGVVILPGYRLLRVPWVVGGSAVACSAPHGRR